jgi:hypothetical protein
MRVLSVNIGIPKLVEGVTLSMTVAEVYRVRHLEPNDLEGARRAANLPALSMEWRDDLLSRLA